MGAGGGTTTWPKIPNGQRGHCATGVPKQEKAGPAWAATIGAWTDVTGGGTDGTPELMQRERRPKMFFQPGRVPRSTGALCPADKHSDKTREVRELPKPRFSNFKMGVS